MISATTKRILLFFIFISSIAGINLFFLMHDACLPIDHEGYFGLNAIQLYYKFQNIAPFSQFHEVSDPPLIATLQALSFICFGVSFTTSKIVPLFFYLLLACTAFGIGIKFNKKTSEGILLALIITSIPYLILQSRHNAYPFYSMCFLFASFFFLIKTNQFRSLKFSILLGLTLGALLLTHEVALPYYLFFLLGIITQKNYFLEKKKSKHNFILSVLLSLTIAYFFWYKNNISNLPQNWFHHMFLKQSLSSTLSLIQAHPWKNIINTLTKEVSLLRSNLFSLYFCILTLSIFIYKSHLKNNMSLNPYLLFSIQLAILILLLSTTVSFFKAELFHWHFIGMYPFFGIIIFQAVISLKNTFLKKIIIISVLLNSIFILTIPFNQITSSKTSLSPQKYTHAVFNQKAPNPKQKNITYLNMYFLFCANIDPALLQKMEHFMNQNWKNKIHNTPIYLYTNPKKQIIKNSNCVSTKNGYKSITEEYCYKLLSKQQ